MTPSSIEDAFCLLIFRRCFVGSALEQIYTMYFSLDKYFKGQRLSGKILDCKQLNHGSMWQFFIVISINSMEVLVTIRVLRSTANWVYFLVLQQLHFHLFCHSLSPTLFVSIPCSSAWNSYMFLKVVTNFISFLESDRNTQAKMIPPVFNFISLLWRNIFLKHQINSTFTSSREILRIYRPSIISRFLKKKTSLSKVFLVGAVSFKEKTPTITVTSVFRQITECMRSGHVLQNFTELQNYWTGKQRKRIWVSAKGPFSFFIF